MHVLDPIGQGPEIADGESNRPMDVRGKKLGVLWNGKPNADNLLRLLSQKLSDRWSMAAVLWEDKVASAGGPAYPATEEIYTRLSSGAVAVLTGSGD